jgi:hypothetical protein
MTGLHGARRADDPAGPTDGVRPDHRLAPSIAIAVAVVLAILLPARLAPGPHWLLPAIEATFLVALVVMDPGRIDRRTRQVRAVSLGLVAVIASSASWAAGALVAELINGDPLTTEASELLLSGALVWADTLIAFSFVFWELDGGGPAARYCDPPRYPQLAFPQQLDPDLAPPGWRPVFVDYLYLSLTNATAFSPTDVMPLARWAKLCMGVQALVSIVILSLVVANSVNLLG